jgi:hypothetical protein
MMTSSPCFELTGLPPGVAPSNVGDYRHLSRPLPLARISLGSSRTPVHYGESTLAPRREEWLEETLSGHVNGVTTTATEDQIRALRQRIAELRKQLKVANRRKDAHTGVF